MNSTPINPVQFEAPDNTAFKFSGISPDDLRKTGGMEDEYTLVIVGEDVSPSTNGYRQSMAAGMKTIQLACRKDPRAEKMMTSVFRFGSRVVETHGFLPLRSIDADQYVPSKTIGSSTCLYDAIYHGIVACEGYAEYLDRTSDVAANAIVFILTDGMNVNSMVGTNTILDKILAIQMNEKLESIKIIILGFGGDSIVIDSLNKLTNDLKLDQFVDIGPMTPTQAAKAFNFISRSISSQSQHLGTGGPSQNLTF